MKNFIQIGDKQIPISDETAKNLREQFKEPERIPCPIKMRSMLGGRLGIPFNDDKQVLHYDRGVYKVYQRSGTFTDCDLIPCKREDLKPGDVAYADDSANPNFLDLYGYNLILDDKSYAYISDGADIFTLSAVYFNRWWKVVKR